MIVLFVVGVASLTGYLIYDYNNKSFSASYSAQERLQKNVEMNAWVAEKIQFPSEDTVTVIESARSKVGSREMTYELAVYRINEEKFAAKQAEAEAEIAAGKDGAKSYTKDTLNGYSKSKAAKDDTLERIGTGIAVTDKGTISDSNPIGDRISMEITMTWDGESR